MKRGKQSVIILKRIHCSGFTSNHFFSNIYQQLIVNLKNCI